MDALYPTIVVGTDGSDSANQALHHAARLAQVAGTRQMHVVMASRRVERAEVKMAMDHLPADWHADPDLYASDKYVLARAAELLEPYGIAVETHLIADAPADAIIGIAEQTAADLIVIGSRGHGAGARMILGSVSTKVVHHAHETCAVLVVNCDA